MGARHPVSRPALELQLGCAYCPFAKRKETRAELARECAALARFSSGSQRCACCVRLSVGMVGFRREVVDERARRPVELKARRTSIGSVTALTNLGSGPPQLRTNRLRFRLE